LAESLFDLDWGDYRSKRPPTMAHVAALELREEILSGALPPGKPLLLVETAERLEMSVMPVREALRRLEFEGLVEQLPQKGARVSPLLLEDLEDIYHARITMESRSVFRASRAFTDESYGRLATVLMQYRDAYEHGDEVKGRQNHEDFHFGLYAVSTSSWTVKLIRVLWNASERYRRLSITRRGSIEDRFREHFDILDACRRLDGEQASDLMTQHLTRSFELVKTDMMAHMAQREQNTTAGE